ncbi:MAG: sigma-70 family RNA polymerase sigma factor [Opitutaceae bacterium]|nr:sigma-70 family RNA polymerase sigma factor [Opitutaceae bacterium]
MLTDPELLRRYAAHGDESAFAELVHRNLGVVYNSALRRLNSNPHLAEEAAQIVFNQLACKAHRLINHPALLGWLHTTTRFAASVIARRESRHGARLRAAAAMHTGDDGTSSATWETLAPMIDEALDCLKPADRQAILLRYFAGRSFAEIGTELSVTEDAARKRIERAMESLRHQFARRGITTCASALAVALTGAPALAAPSTLAGTIAATATTVAAGTGGSIASLFFGIMSTAKVSSVTFVTCSLLGVAALGTAFVTWSEHLKREQRQLDAMSAQASAIRSRLRQLGTAAAANQRTADARASGAPTSPTGGLSAAIADQLRVQQILATNPLYAPMREQMFRLLAQREFGPFFAARNYPADTVELIRKGLVRYYEAREAANWRYNTAPDADAVRRLKAESEQEQRRFLDDLRPALPDKEVEDIARCFAAQRVLSRAREVSLELADARAPMDQVQELALAMIIADRGAAAESAGAEARNLARAVDPETGLSADDRANLDDAAAFLSPAQLKLYEHYLRQENVRSALQARARDQVAAGPVRP